MTRRTSMLLLGAYAVAGCGGEAAPPKTPADAPESASDAPLTAAPRRASRGGMSVTTELGEIDAAATERVFQGAHGDLAACFKRSTGHVEFLGGELAFFLRIGGAGEVKWAFLERSSLGDRRGERCMLDALERAKWPKPRGGDAEVKKTVAFDASPDVRAPAAWSADRVNAAAGEVQAKIAACKEGAPGAYAVTAYVEPDGNQGRVLSAGVAPPGKLGEAKADCVTDVVGTMKMPSPGSYAAKVSFVL